MLYVALSPNMDDILGGITEKLFRDLVYEPYGIKMLAVYENGHWEVHGKGRNPTWTQINGDITVGQSTFEVATDVDWQVLMPSIPPKIPKYFES